MSKCVDERIGNNPGKPSFKIPLSSIKAIIQMLKCAFTMSNGPLPYISADQIAFGVENRTGLDKGRLYSAFLNSAKAAGINTGPNTDGSDNKINKMFSFMANNTISELVENAVVENALKQNTFLGNGYAGTPINIPYNAKIKGIFR